MTDESDDRSRDAMLLRALKTPPLSRAQLTEELARAKADKPTPPSKGVESSLGETTADH